MTAISRRGVLAGLGLGALSGVAGCGGGPRGLVRVAVVFSGLELTSFRRVLDAFTRRYGVAVDVVSLGSDIGALLGNRLARDVADVMFLPRPGMVHQYQDQLVTLDPGLADAYPTGWQQLVKAGDRELGVWFKSAHKSLVWYRPDIFDEVGVSPPPDWPSWMQLNQKLIGAGIAPLALGAASGWVLTDWVENVLLCLDAEAYRQLANQGRGWRAPAVGQTLQLLGEMWGTPGALRGGVNRALLTEFEQSIVDVFTDRRAAMIFEADFVYSVINQLAAPDAQFHWFPFPIPPQGQHRVVVGGDVAVLLRPATASGQLLIAWLASAEAAMIWAQLGGFTSVNQDVPNSVYPPDYPMSDPRLLAEVRAGNHGLIDFDMSDQLLGPLAGGEGHGEWAILQQFLRDVGTTGGDHQLVAAVVARTVNTLATVAGEA